MGLSIAGEMVVSGSSHGHGPPVNPLKRHTTQAFGQEVKMKCPKSEEFLEIITHFIPKMCAVGAF